MDPILATPAADTKKAELVPHGILNNSTPFKAMNASTVTIGPKRGIKNVKQSLGTFNTFTLFPKLPLELRRKIWQLMCSEPHNVDIVRSYDYTTSQPHQGMPRPTRLTRYASTCAVPAVLQISHEARTEGLWYYSIDFSNTYQSGQKVIIHSAPRIYINWAIDCLCIVSSGYPHDEKVDTGLFDLCISKNVRHLAYNTHYMGQQSFRPIKYSQLRQLGLESLVLFERRYSTDIRAFPAKSTSASSHSTRTSSEKMAAAHSLHHKPTPESPRSSVICCRCGIKSSGSTAMVQMMELLFLWVLDQRSV